jgi:hypothetical protein
MKLSLLKKILLALSFITVVSLLLVWIVVRPKYEAANLAERITNIRQLQKCSIENIDQTFTGWSQVPRFIISQVAERPSEGESILRIMMMLHPEIIQIRIHSAGPSDELRSQNTSYPPFTLQFPDSVWLHSNIDSTLSIAWMNHTELPTPVVVLQTQFQAQKIPFTLTIVYNAKRLNILLDRIPFNKDCSISVHSGTGVITQNVSSFKFDGIHLSMDTSSTLQTVHEGIQSWRVLTSPFQSVQLWMVMAVPEDFFAQPVKDFTLYSAALIVGPMLLLLILGWLLSFQTKRLIEKLKPVSAPPGEQ